MPINDPPEPSYGPSISTLPSDLLRLLPEHHSSWQLVNPAKYRYSRPNRTLLFFTKTKQGWKRVDTFSGIESGSQSYIFLHKSVNQNTTQVSGGGNSKIPKSTHEERLTREKEDFMNSPILKALTGPPRADLEITVVRRGDDKPIVNAQVICNETQTTLQTNKKGIAIFKGLKLGKYTFTTEKDYHSPETVYYTIVKKSTTQLTINVTAGKAYFVIHHTEPDNAFKRAADTWKEEILNSPKFKKHDVFLAFKAEKFEPDFKVAWEEIHQEITSLGVWAGTGHLLSHASIRGTTSTRGLEFKRNGTGDTTITQDDMKKLAVLDWHKKDGHLLMTSCNSGVVKDGWCPAMEFASRQKVRVTGQTGFAYFSEEKNVFNWSDPIDRVFKMGDHYLWAYHRRKNLKQGEKATYTRMPSVEFR